MDVNRKPKKSWNINPAHLFIIIETFEQTPQKSVLDPHKKKTEFEHPPTKDWFRTTPQKIRRTGSGQNYKKHPDITAKIILYTERLLAYSPVLLSLDFQKASVHINGMKAQ